MKKRPAVPIPPPPRHLSKLARSWWKRICSGWDLDDAALLVLEATLQALDRWQQAKAILDAEGLVTHDRWGQAKPHPACLAERDNRAAVARGLKQLGLDLEPLHPGPGRPPGR